MKITNTVTAVSLALTTTTSLAAASPIACWSTKNCPTNTYCHPTQKICLNAGTCVVPKDCENPENAPFPQVYCLGTPTCEFGQCGIDCGVFPPEEPACKTSKDCSSDSYCHETEKTCKEIGTCAAVSDCQHPDNAPLKLKRCGGALICDDGRCDIACGYFPKEEAPPQKNPNDVCQTSDDCPDDWYCSDTRANPLKAKVCNANGHCNVAADCDNADNFFFSADCVGTTTCDNGTCGVVCDEFCATSQDCSADQYCHGPSGTCKDKPADECTTSKDCPDDWYCSESRKNPFGIKTCNANGYCNEVSDCDNPDNMFGLAACVGTKTCDNGKCGIQCQVDDDDEGCSSDADCASGLEYCAADRTCQPMGGCSVDDDCFNTSNDLMLVDCIGTLSCQSRFCTKTCSELKGRLDDVTAASSSSVEGQDLVLPEAATSTSQLRASITNDALQDSSAAPTQRVSLIATAVAAVLVAAIA